MLTLCDRGVAEEELGREIARWRGEADEAKKALDTLTRELERERAEREQEQRRSSTLKVRCQPFMWKTDLLYEGSNTWP